MPVDRSLFGLKKYNCTEQIPCWDDDFDGPPRGGIRSTQPPAELTTTLQPASGGDIGGTVFCLTYLAGSE